jgi:hypothetical protein
MTSVKYRKEAQALSDTAFTLGKRLDELAESGVGEDTRRTLEAAASGVDAVVELIELSLARAIHQEFTP